MLMLPVHLKSGINTFILMHVNEIGKYFLHEVLGIVLHTYR